MEQIQDHPIQDVWRVKSGLLVVINKYRSKGNSYYYSSEMKSKVVRGCKGLKQLTAPYKDLPVGTLMFGRVAVEPHNNIRDFKVEVKSSGGTIEGGIGDIQDVMNDIDIILAKYLFEGGK
jgi:hypothetical protein